MTCEKAGDLLSAYIEGELTGRRCTALETHLSGCEGCREELETLKNAVALLAAPKSFARPEGLLEEFKAKYLPEAEAAAEAPRWGFRLPVLPKFEWPSLGRVMLPMGGMAAAAAALLVALHGNPIPSGNSPVASHHSGPRMAAVPTASNSFEPDPTTVAGKTASTPARALTAATAKSSTGTTPLKDELHSSGNEKRTVGRTQPVARPRLEAAPLRPASTHRRHAMVLAAAVIPERRHVRRSLGPGLKPYGRYASNTTAGPAVSASEMTRLGGYQKPTPSPEDQWADIAIATRRKASAAAVEEGYAEVSCKNLATGQVKSMAVGSPIGPTAAPLTGEGQTGVSGDRQ